MITDLTTDGLTNRECIDWINVVGFSGDTNEETFHQLADVRLDVQAYELFHEEESEDEIAEKHPDDDGSPRSRHTMLPSASLDGLWESLVYSDEFPDKILRFATRMSKCKYLMSDGLSSTFQSE